MKIAIAGTGIGGLAAASLAAQSGHEISLYDQFKTTAPVGSGLVIQPVGLRILEHLGAAEEALDKGARGYYMIGHEARSGRKVLDVTYGPSDGTNFGLGIHRASLFQSLLAAAKRNNVQIIPNHRVVGTVLKNGLRYLEFDNAEVSGPFDLVIDALGASSPISPLRAKTLPYGAIWATVDWGNNPMSYDCLRQKYRRAHNMIGILPIGSLPNETARKAALFWSLPSDGYQHWLDTPLKDWRKSAIELWPELEPFVVQIKKHSQMTFASYSHGSLGKPYSEKLVHIGDAAHRASPQLGQGANMALLDAYALFQSLAKYPIEKALPKYVSARKAHTKFYQAMSWVFTPMYQSDSRILPLIRDYVLGPLSAVPPVPRILSSLVKGTMVSPSRGLD